MDDWKRLYRGSRDFRRGFDDFIGFVQEVGKMDKAEIEGFVGNVRRAKALIPVATDISEQERIFGDWKDNLVRVLDVVRVSGDDVLLFRDGKKARVLLTRNGLRRIDFGCQTYRSVSLVEMVDVLVSQRDNPVLAKLVLSDAGFSARLQAFFSAIQFVPEFCSLLDRWVASSEEAVSPTRIKTFGDGKVGDGGDDLYDLEVKNLAFKGRYLSINDDSSNEGRTTICLDDNMDFGGYFVLVQIEHLVKPFLSRVLSGCVRLNGEIGGVFQRIQDCLSPALFLDNLGKSVVDGG